MVKKKFPTKVCAPTLSLTKEVKSTSLTNRRSRYGTRGTTRVITWLFKVHSVGWSCDGSRLASGSYDKAITIWSLESDRLGREGNYKVEH